MIFRDLTFEITVGNERRRVTPQQWEILALLRKRQGKLVPYLSFATVAYDRRWSFSLRGFQVQICNLRKKLGGTPYRIEGIRAEGYRLVGDG